MSFIKGFSWISLSLNKWDPYNSNTSIDVQFKKRKKRKEKKSIETEVCVAWEYARGKASLLSCMQQITFQHISSDAFSYRTLFPIKIMGVKELLSA
jgi:hypothetical protein